MDVRKYSMRRPATTNATVEIPSHYLLFITFDSVKAFERWSQGRLKLDEHRLEHYVCASMEEFNCRYKAYTRRRRCGEVELWVRPGPHIHHDLVEGSALGEKRVSRSRTSRTSMSMASTSTNQPEVRSPPLIAARSSTSGRVSKPRKSGPRRVIDFDAEAPRQYYVLVEKIPPTVDVESLLIRIFSFLHSTTSPPSMWELRRDVREGRRLVWLAGYLDKRQAKLAVALLDEEEVCGQSVQAELLAGGEEDRRVRKVREMPLVEDSIVWRAEVTVMTIGRRVMKQTIPHYSSSRPGLDGPVPLWAVPPPTSLFSTVFRI